MKYFLIALFSLGFFFSTYQAIKLYKQVMHRKTMKEDLAEINRVNYELFNVELWKTEALDIFQKRIKEFEISQQMYSFLDVQVQAYLNSMYDRYFESGELINMISDQLEQGGKINKMFLSMIKKNVVEQLDNLDLRSQIPGLSNQIMTEIRSNEPLIKSYMQKELLRLVLDEGSNKLHDRRELIYTKYNKGNLSDTEFILTNEIGLQDKEILSISKILIGSFFFLIVVSIMLYKYSFEISVGLLTLSSILLLALGISLPMIDIDARLNSFVFELLGEPISFDEQVIYFQSKSIIEVTKTLWQSGGADLKAVGALVLLFSIIFPFFKLLLSASYLFNDRIRKSSLAQNVIFHLGKWSMADVFVVAIFMAYIGMYGVITSQLSAIDQNQGGFAIETLNYSKLSPGAFYFTAYTILSVVIGILINKKSNSLKDT